MKKKDLDWAVDELKQNKEKSKVFLDPEAKKIEAFDKKIKWFQGQIKSLESQKQKELSKFSELLDLAMVSTHSLYNGYTIKPDNKREISIDDIASFMKWLKTNKKPHEVLEFFSGAIKKTSLKRFCDKEANEQRINGIRKPSIDGISFGEVTFRRLTTEYKSERKSSKSTKEKS